MIKGLFILSYILLAIILLPKLIKILGIKSETDFKDSLSEIASNEIKELKSSLGITKKYQKLADSIIKEAEERLGVDISSFESDDELKHPNVAQTQSSRTVLTDDSDHPFQITKELADLTDEIINDAVTDINKLRNIFNWFSDNIVYGTQKREINNGYRTSNEVFRDKEGICGEMASLFVVMSRYIGIKSNYVSVKKDLFDKSVYHACSGVQINGETILIDPAYKTFDAKHKDFVIRTDIEAIEHIKSWRNK